MGAGFDTRNPPGVYTPFTGTLRIQPTRVTGTTFDSRPTRKERTRRTREHSAHLKRVASQTARCFDSGRGILATFRRVAAPRLITERLELRPLPAAAAAALQEDREGASRTLGAALPDAWPQPDLLDVLPLQAAAPAENERFGVWVMIERDSRSVVGDIGFIGPPDENGSVEVGYSVVPGRRRRGYATEAARAIVEWALRQPGVQVVVAGCDSDNAPSIRTLERVGFRRTGEANGQIRWCYDRSPTTS